MKKKNLLLSILAGLCLAFSAQAADSMTGVQSSILTGTASVSLLPSFSGLTSLQVTGTWYGTLVPQVSNDGTNYVTANCYTMSGSPRPTILGNGAYRIDSAGWAYVRVTATAYTGGAAVLTMRNSPAANPVAVGDSSNVFKTMAAVSSVGSAWIPATTSRFTLKWCALTTSSAGLVTLFDGATTITAFTSAAGGAPTVIYLGKGYSSSALGMTLTVLAAAGTISGTLAGTEEP